MADYDCVLKRQARQIRMKGLHPGGHLQHVFAAAGAITGQICGPGVDFFAGNRILGAHFPGAEIHFRQARIELRCSGAAGSRQLPGQRRATH